MEFAEAFQRLLGNEGAYSEDANDPGNWTGGRVGEGELRGTKYGISAKSYPALDIANLTEDQAQAIYYADYWMAHKLDQLPDVLRFDVFDGAVNSGLPTDPLADIRRQLEMQELTRQLNQQPTEEEQM